MLAIVTTVNGQTERPAEPYPQRMIQGPTAPAGWFWIAGYYGPNIPPGWQITNIESVIYQGNSVTRWVIYLYNPTTHQTAGWLIGVN